jgi:hypothetical protein
MAASNLEIYYPRYITLGNDQKILIPKEQISNENLFSLFVPTGKIDEIVKYLEDNEGFSSASPSIPEGEDRGISKVVMHPWELHLRFYYNSIQPPFGKIQAHFEISREYFEHLGTVVPCVYEPFEYYKVKFPEFVLWYNPSKQWVKSIEENYKISASNPASLTPWKPVVTTAIAVGLFTGLLYAISKLSPPRDEK